MSIYTFTASAELPPSCFPCSAACRVRHPRVAITRTASPLPTPSTTASNTPTTVSMLCVSPGVLLVDASFRRFGESVGFNVGVGDGDGVGTGSGGGGGTSSSAIVGISVEQITSLVGAAA